MDSKHAITKQSRLDYNLVTANLPTLLTSKGVGAMGYLASVAVVATTLLGRGVKAGTIITRLASMSKLRRGDSRHELGMAQVTKTNYLKRDQAIMQDKLTIDDPTDTITAIQ
ncbi:hypothetical protein EDC04DRAFT_2613288 [Pisolithus marmoratus]|nr:hypothetical protein EDC04DRAFT_2613288 [Pisolithus marmoratus]